MHHCKPDLFADIVPATPDDRQAVVISCSNDEMTLKATTPVESRTPIKLHIPAPCHCHVRIQGMRVNHGRNGVGRVVKTVHEFKSKRDQQSDPQ